MSVAIYPGTFDPVHAGHVDIAKRAARLFDRVIVAIYDRSNKNLMFSIGERVSMAQQAFAECPKITVESYGELTVDFCRKRGSRVIVRGLRVISDFELEYQMALSNRKMAPDIEVVCLMTSLEHAFLSSSIVKEIALAGGPIAEFVPPHVADALYLRTASRR